MTVLELSRVTKRFGDFTAVADVSLTVDKGQILSLPGPSGCPLEQTGKPIDLVFRPEDCIIVPADS